MRHVFSLIVVLLLAGCATKDSTHFARIAPGQNRQEVEHLVGQPSNAVIYQDVSYLTYYLNRTGEDSIGEHLVRMRHGLVEIRGENSVKGTTTWPEVK